MKQETKIATKKSWKKPHMTSMQMEGGPIPVSPEFTDGNIS